MAIQEVFYKETKKNIAGTTGDDLILIDNSGALASTDVIDGGAGTDILRIAALTSGKYVLSSGVTGVEVVEISESLEETSSTDASSTAYMGISAINVDASLIATPLTIKGNDGANEIKGGSGSDTLYGYGGDDAIFGNAGTNAIYGGDGNDYIVINTATIEGSINGGDGKDYLLYSGANVFTLNPAGLGLVTGIEEIMLGTVTNGKLSAKETTNSSIDASLATLGLKLTGNAGINILTGGSGNDTLNGGAGKDTLRGSAGSDVFLFSSSTDLVTGEVIDGGEDADGLDVDVAMFTGSGTYKLTGVTFNGIEKIVVGGSSTAGIDATGVTTAQTLQGNKAANALTGGSGDDVLVGGGGTDKLTGGAGDDLFVFNHGAEGKTAQIDGGTGTNTIVFNETLTSKSYVFNTLVLDPAKIKNVSKFVIDSDTNTGVNNQGYLGTALNTDGTGSKGGSLNLNIDASKATAAVTLVGNDGVNILIGGKGGDTFYGGTKGDTFVFSGKSIGDLSTATEISGTTVAKRITVLLDTIKDWNGAAGSSDVIDYDKDLSFDTVSSPTSGTVVLTSGLASGFTAATTDNTTLLAQVKEVIQTLDSKEASGVNVGGDGAVAGETAFWKVGSDTYVLISDGKAGKSTAPLTSGDLLIKLESFDGTQANYAQLVNGNLLFTADANATGQAGNALTLTTATDTISAGLTSTNTTTNDDVIDGRTPGTLNAADSIVDAYTTDNDVLNATISTALTLTLPGAITKIETINITDTFGGSVFTTGGLVTGAKEMVLDTTSANKSVAISGVDGAKITKVKAGDNVTNFAVSDITGNPVLIQNKASTITLDGATADTDTVTLNLSGVPVTLAAGADDIKTLNLVTSGTSSTVTLNTSVLDAATATIAISGNADLTLKASAADLKVASLVTVTDTLSGSAKFHVELTSVANNTATDISGVSADDFIISSSTQMGTGDITFKTGVTNLTLTKNVVDSTGGFFAAGTGISDHLKLTETVANTNLVTSGFERIDFTNSTNAALTKTTTNVSATGDLYLYSDRDLTLGAATFRVLDASNVSNLAKITVTSAAITNGTLITSNENTATIDMSLSSGANVINTFAGNDVIKLGSGNDVVNAGAGSDAITFDVHATTPGTDTDTIFAQAGDDTVSLNGNEWTTGDKLDGGDGIDTLKITAGTAGTTNINLLAAGVDAFTNFEKIDVSGLIVAQTITLGDQNVKAGAIFSLIASASTSGAITFDGSTETDGQFNLTGGAAAAGDTLKGGAGADTLIGGDGTDNLTGGSGVDKFVFAATGALNDADTITDFKLGATGDKLDFSAFSLTSGALHSALIAPTDLAGLVISNKLVLINKASITAADFGAATTEVFDKATTKAIVVAYQGTGDAKVYFVDTSIDVTTASEIQAADIVLVGTLTGVNSNAEGWNGVTGLVASNVVF